jgi:hypothetical protein
MVPKKLCVAIRKRLTTQAGRIVFFGALTFPLVCVALFSVAFPPANPLTPDSRSYLDFAPTRQPLYGIWANALSFALGDFSSVAMFQLALFVASWIWLNYELISTSVAGGVSAVAASCVLLILSKLGLLSVVGSIHTEGVVYTVVLVTFALLQRSARRRSRWPLVFICLLCVAASQIRTAVLLWALLPIAALSLFICLSSPRESARGWSHMLLLFVIGAITVIPWAIGKAPGQLSTVRSGIGFAAMARVTQLSGSWQMHLDPPTRQMMNSWRERGEDLSVAAFSQFDGQLQEAVRFEIGPKVIVPQMSRSQTPLLNSEGIDREQIAASTLARAIRSDPWRYLRTSVAHTWGAMTGANYMGNRDRAATWQALNSVSPDTWRLAKFRTDYPNNRIDQPLTVTTSVVYVTIRLLMVVALLAFAIAAVRFAIDAARGRPVHCSHLVLIFGGALFVSHSLVVGLTVFPEFRFVYLNILIAIGALCTAVASSGKMLTIEWRFQRNL